MHSRRGPALAVALPAAGVLLVVAAVQTGAAGSAQRWLFGTAPTPVSLGVAPSTEPGSAGPSQVPGLPTLDPASPLPTPSLELSVEAPGTSPTGFSAPTTVRRTTAQQTASRQTTRPTVRRATTKPTTTKATIRPTTEPTSVPTPTTKPTTKPTLEPTTSSPAPTRSQPAPDPGGSDLASEVVRLTNAQRTANGCPALTVDSRLTRAAQGHSDDMRDRNFFAHDNPDGKSPFDRMKAAGYTYRMAAENIAAGQPTPAAVVDAWMKSAGHRANILNCGLTQIGVGVASGGSYRIYWTQNFGTPR